MSHDCVIERPKDVGSAGPCRCPITRIDREIKKLRADGIRLADALRWLHEKSCACQSGPADILTFLCKAGLAIEAHEEMVNPPNESAPS